MSDEVPQILERTIDLLVTRIFNGGSGYGFGLGPTEIRERLAGPGDLPHLTRLAVTASVHDLILTSTANRLGEEHQTSSLMGHLATNLGWYSLLYAVLVGRPEAKSLSNVYWAAPDHRAEARLGADFAIISGSTSKASGPCYRVKLFQAKKELRDGTFSISHEISPTKGNPAHRETAAHGTFFPILRVVTEQEAVYSDKIKQLVADKPFVRPGYQLEAFARSHIYGNCDAASSINWCFYALWPFPKDNNTVGEPLCCRLVDVITHVLFDEGPPKTYPSSKVDLPLIDLISSTIDPDFDDNTSLLLNEVNLRKLLPSITDLIPGIEMIGVGDEGSGGGLMNALSDAGFAPVDASLGSAALPGPEGTIMQP